MVFDYEGKGHDLVFDHDEVEGITKKAKGVINFDLSFDFILKEAPITPKEEILETNPLAPAR